MTDEFNHERLKSSFDPSFDHNFHYNPKDVDYSQYNPMYGHRTRDMKEIIMYVQKYC